MRIATYARVSTERQENEQTIEAQLMAISEKVKDEKHVVITNYADAGWSGMILARPGLDQLRIDAHQNDWEAVIVYDPDRIARKYAFIQLIVDELEALGKQVLFVTMPPANDDTDKLLFGVKGIFAEYERARIADRFRLGKLRKARDGYVITSTAPYGYEYIRKDQSNQGHYRVIPDEARLIKQIFGWIADEQMTIRGVVRRLKELGIKPRKSDRGVWSTSTLTNMLRNESYIGKAYYLKSEGIKPIKPLKEVKYRRVTKTSRRMRSKAQWIGISVPSIIDEALFWKVRRQLEDNYKLCQRNRKNEYLLAGKIFCTCGQRRCGEGSKENNHLYYRCSDRIHCFPNDPKCKIGGINAVVADALVWKKISDFMSDPTLIGQQIRRYYADRNGKGESSILREQLQRELIADSRKEKRYIELYADARISRKELNEKIDELMQHKNRLESELRAIGDREDMIALPTDDKITQFTRRIQAGIGSLNFQAKRGILLKLVDKVVSDQRSMTVTGCLPLGEQLTGYLDHRNVAYGSISRYCWTTKCG